MLEKFKNGFNFKFKINLNKINLTSKLTYKASETIRENSMYNKI